MIAYFPELYPDELLYSGIARLCNRLGFSQHRLVLEKLFCATNVSALIDLPRNINQLISELPMQDRLACDELIDNHTLLPFYSPFVTSKRLQDVRTLMKRGCQSPVQMTLGLTRSQVQSPGSLRFCPSCQEEDVEKFGEPYWHRVPQIRGFEICPKHQVFIEESTVERLIREKTSVFRCASLGQKRKLARGIGLTNSDHHTLVRLANNIEWVVNQRALFVGVCPLQKIYLNLLKERGFTTCNGRLYSERLLVAFRQKFPDRLLRKLHCQLQIKQETSWLIRLIRTPKGLQAPLRHLLFIDFLGYTAEEFFTGVVGNAIEPYRPFGEGPWQCYNPVCSKRFARPIKRVTIRHCFQHKEGVGIFSCPDCGFIYRKLISEVVTNRRWTVDFGPVWRRALKGLWRDPRRTIREMKEMLEADSLTIKRHAIRLGCKYPRAPLGVKSVARIPA